MCRLGDGQFLRADCLPPALTVSKHVSEQRLLCASAADRDYRWPRSHTLARACPRNAWNSQGFDLFLAALEALTGKNSSRPGNRRPRCAGLGPTRFEKPALLRGG